MERLCEKKFRAAQIYEWLHKRCVRSFEEMTNISKALREKLEASYDPVILKQEALADHLSFLGIMDATLFNMMIKKHPQ